MTQPLINPEVIKSLWFSIVSVSIIAIPTLIIVYIYIKSPEEVDEYISRGFKK